jgi:hypothetical protein
MPKIYKKIRMLLLLSLCLTIGLTDIAHAKKTTLATDHNLLEKPKYYREWIYIGTALTPHDLNDGHASFPEFHNVYINPLGWQAWKAKGKFIDGTVIVKELLSVGDHQAVSGKGYFQGEFSVVAVAVKDKRRFANEPGNWGYFLFDSPSTTTTTAKPTASCAACHVAHAQTDLAFTQYYPILRSVKP